MEVYKGFKGRLCPKQNSIKNPLIEVRKNIMVELDSSIDYYFIGSKDSLQKFCNDVSKLTVHFNWSPDPRDIRKYNTSCHEWLLTLSSINCGINYKGYLKTISELLEHYPDIEFYYVYSSPKCIFTNDIKGKIIMPFKGMQYKSVNML